MRKNVLRSLSLLLMLTLSWVLGLTACASSGNKEKNTSDTTAEAQTELQEKEEASMAQTELQEKEEADTEPETGSGSTDGITV